MVRAGPGVSVRGVAVGADLAAIAIVVGVGASAEGASVFGHIGLLWLMGGSGTQLCARESRAYQTLIPSPEAPGHRTGDRNPVAQPLGLRRRQGRQDGVSSSHDALAHRDWNGPFGVAPETLRLMEQPRTRFLRGHERSSLVSSTRSIPGALSCSFAAFGGRSVTLRGLHRAGYGRTLNEARFCYRARLCRCRWALAARLHP